LRRSFATSTIGKVLFPGPNYDFPIAAQEVLYRSLGRTHEGRFAAANFVVANLDKGNRAAAMLVNTRKQFIGNTLSYSSFKPGPLAKRRWWPQNLRFEAQVICGSAFKAHVSIA
jgi:hypothetical protein